MQTQRRNRRTPAPRAVRWQIRTVAIDSRRADLPAIDDCSGCGCDASGCPAPLQVQARPRRRRPQRGA